MKVALTLAVLCLSWKGVHAWGANGHRTVGFVAMEFLAPEALSFVKSSLGATYSQSLGVAATWADEVRSQAAYSWSAPYHFVDAEDAPKSWSCSVNQARDCADGKCIMTAISNYTTRVTNTGLSATQRQEALKFLDHFIGDIGQPLHVEALALGGNQIDAICSGSRSNLHSVWDTGMLEKHIKANFGDDAQRWADSLVSRIKTGSFKSQAAGWISCSSTTQRSTLLTRRSRKAEAMEMIAERAENAIPVLQCPLVWAAESNEIDCSLVFNFSTGQDLCTSSYFSQAILVIELQIAKQGYRLAAWLNVLFDGATNLP